MLLGLLLVDALKNEEIQQRQKLQKPLVFEQPSYIPGSAPAGQFGWNQLGMAVSSLGSRKLANSFYPVVLKIRSPASPNPGTMKWSSFRDWSITQVCT